MARSINRLTIAVLVVGLIIGGWRSWGPRAHVEDDIAVNGGVTIVPLLTTKTKSIWIQHEVTEFNAAHDKVQVHLKFIEARDAMDSIIYGKQKPVLWCPDSPLWVVRVNDLWRSRHGRELVDDSSPSDVCVTMRTPLVFLTTADKARFLGPLLGSDHAWQSIESMSNGDARTPWGGFRLANADPLYSNSGILMLAMIANEYAAANGASPAPALASDAGFNAHLKTIEGSARIYPGTFELTQAYAATPSIADAIVTYESAAMDAVRHNHQLAVIYPQPTMVAEETVCVVGGPWATDTQKEVAREFVAFLRAPESAHDSTVYDMRPPALGDDSGIDRKLTALESNGFRTMYTSSSLPPYDVLNALIYDWGRMAASATRRVAQR
jgi:hypothetical protein